ncbi:4-alpha-glucanotransferase [Streptomyces sp. NPDC002851]
MTLDRLAALHGVATSYNPAPDRTVQAPPPTVVAALAALGVDASSPEAVRAALAAREAELRDRLLPPTVVQWPDAPAPALTALPPGTRLCIATEEGGTVTATVSTAESGEAELPVPALPLGVHALHAEAPDGRTADAHLVVAPARAPEPPPGRSYGLLVQLYSLLSTRSWGMGDLGDLADLAAWSGRALGVDFLQLNPLHAAVQAAPGEPTDPSPYRPSSRRFPDPVHLRIEDIPEYAHLSPDARKRAADLLERAERRREAVLREGALIDRDAVWALKSAALELILDVPLSPGRRAAYCDFLAAQGPALETHATYRALAERHGPDWRDWPKELTDPASPAIARAAAELIDRIDVHCRLAWLTDTQLAAADRAAREAGMGIGLVHDLAVGVHPGGADAWAQRACHAAGMTVGAPPDAFNSRGQDWGLPPWRPDALAAVGYAPFRDLLRGLLAHAGALRIDHVMGLFRLWWIPEGRPPTEGTYVHYDADAMLAILVLEAHRAGAAVIGEDLGTVAPGVREALRERGVLGTSVLWFERDWDGNGGPLPPEDWRPDCLATVTTHDLPPTAARLTGAHVRLRHRLGLLPAPEGSGDGFPLATALAGEAAEVGEWLAALARLGLLPPGSTDEQARIRAFYAFLLRTPARMVGLWLPDAVGDRRPQNVPGTCDAYPNWRLPVADATGRPVTLEDLAAAPRLHALATALGQQGLRA